jgi:hypothetical protein
VIKVIRAVRRLPGVPAEEFHAWWRDEYAPRVAQNAGALRLRRYVQLHALATAEAESAATNQPEFFDGFDERWFDSLEDSNAFAKHVAAELGVEEARYIDVARSLSPIPTLEYVVIDAPRADGPLAGLSAGLTLMHCLHRSPQVTRAEFLRWWSGQHRDVVLRVSESRRQTRDVQNHVLPDWAEECMARGEAEPYIGFKENSWHSLEDRASALASTEGQQASRALQDDGTALLDRARSSVVFTTPVVVITGDGRSVVS